MREPIEKNSLSVDEKLLIEGVMQTASLFLENERKQSGESLDDYIYKKKIRFFEDQEALQKHLHLGYAAMLEILSQNH